MFNRLCKLTLLGAALLGGPVAARAQTPMPVAQMTDSPCPPPPPRPPQEMLDAMLKPGAKPPPMPAAGDEKLREYLKQHAEDLARDYADLCHYKSDNAAILKGAQPKAVFMGDSITEGWRVGDPSLFTRGVIDRGISGQTSPQMLVRFYQDVVALHPRAVHIMAGTNDVAGNTGPSSPEDFKNNIRAMVDLASTHDIHVVLASICRHTFVAAGYSSGRANPAAQCMAATVCSPASADLRRLLCIVGDTCRCVSP